MQLSRRIGRERARRHGHPQRAERPCFHFLVALQLCALSRSAFAEPEKQKDGDTVTHVRSEFSFYDDTDAVMVVTPSVGGTVESPTTGWSGDGSYLVDVVSAASVDIVSTASSHWRETRQAGTLGVGYKPGTVGGRLNASVSSEPDYLSLSAGGTLSLELAHKTANPSLTYAYTHDTAGRSGTPFSVFSLELQRHTIAGSLELVLSGSTALELGLEGMLERGDQTKPYRFIPLFAPDIAARIVKGESVDLVNKLRTPGRTAEATPLTRNRVAASGRLAHRFSSSTLVLTERLYGDDWGLKASTTDLRYVIDLSRRVFLWGHIRGHVQSGVSFWKLAYVGGTGAGVTETPRYRTGDRELSPLQAGTVGAGLRFEVGSETSPWAFTVQGDFFTTSFSDTLFITSRQGGLGIAQVETSF